MTAYEQSPIAAEVSDVYRANVLRAVRRVAKDCAFGTPADFDREAVEKWLAERITGAEKMGARSRNYYRESLTVDVHAVRTTFGTMLSKTGAAPRTAQAAMRHSDIKLTIGVYTDPRLLDVRCGREVADADFAGRCDRRSEGANDRHRKRFGIAWTSVCTNSVQPGSIRVIWGH